MRSSTEWIILAFIWVFASLTHALTKLQTVREDPSENKRRYDAIDFAVALSIAGFSGIIFYITASLFFSNFLAIALFTGIGGYLGGDGLRKVAPAAQDFLLNLLTKK